jgi:hypothetical protein
MVKSSSVLGCAAVVIAIPLAASTASAAPGGPVSSEISELASQPTLQQPWTQSDQVNGKTEENVQVAPVHLRHAMRELQNSKGKCVIL